MSQIEWDPPGLLFFERLLLVFAPSSSPEGRKEAKRRRSDKDLVRKRLTFPQNLQSSESSF